jgi:hypothetical protein
VLPPLAGTMTITITATITVTIAITITIIITITIVVTAQAGTEILGDKGGRLLVVSKEVCYRKTETLEDAEEAARWWRYNLVQ